MKRKPKFTLEKATCAVCKTWFWRYANASRKRRVCYDPRCQKITKLGRDKPVKFADMKTRRCSEYRADIDYHGSTLI